MRIQGATLPDGLLERPAFAVRMGLRYVKSLSEERDWRRIEAARAEAVLHVDGGLHPPHAAR